MNNEVLEQLKQEYNELLNRAQDIGDILAHCAEMDTSHCGQDAAPAAAHTCDSLKELEGMQVIKVCSPKCKDCPCGDGLREYPSGRDASSCVKVELVGGSYLCLAPQDKSSADDIDTVVINPQEQ